MKTKEHYETIRRLRQVEGELAYSLDVFGDKLAEREKYKAVDGIDAVHFYLVHKFGWLPSVVRSMSPEDLRFVLLEEMAGFTLPKAAKA
ncbi:hypothetical protein EGJ86_07245 [Pseudomonas sp. o96-267]|uniref:hypothetical protein n=1 Tax=Pseudomonas sp. o96-267 TaxID=2479853 RepID=UPI000F7B4462|nr:hypothetical protein [Pseudomonas sp. o96-267]RRV41271.1 hypothetical protein EGJ86_07245 [Pseudomonas sp. o96-267]